MKRKKRTNQTAEKPSIKGKIIALRAFFAVWTGIDMRRNKAGLRCETMHSRNTGGSKQHLTDTYLQKWKT